MPEAGRNAPRLPPAVWLIPWAGLILLPSAGQGPIGSRLAVLFAELLLGLPLLIATPRVLRPQILPVPPLGRRWRWAAALLALPVALLYQALHIGMTRLLPGSTDAEQAVRLALTPGSLPESLLIGSSLLLAAPVMEELFFRGLLPWLWQRRWRRGVVLGPALVFALSHASLPSLPSLLILGLLLGWLRQRSGSLVPGMVLHFAVNLTGFLMLWLPNL